MSRARVAVVVGTRPEAVKMAPVIRELRASIDLEPVVISTGQHRQMLPQILDPFGITVDHDLSLMEPNQSLYRLSAKAMEAFERVLAAAAARLVLVQGDTTTAFLAALCAFYARIPVGHVEAGLRTYNRYSPFPEEMNRKLITSIAELHFAPTELNRAALLREGADDASVVVTGNTGIDSLHQALGLDAGSPPVTQGRLVLITLHRRESFGAPLAGMLEAIAEVAAAQRDVTFLYAVHLNPNVQGPAHEILGRSPNVMLTEPLDYFSFVKTMARAEVIITDSGGIQEEAPALGVPVLVLRNETERKEAIDAGAVQLVGTDRANIVRELARLLSNPSPRDPLARKISPYGDGRASARIVARLRDFLWYKPSLG